LATKKAVESAAGMAGNPRLSSVFPFCAIGLAGLLRDSWPAGLHLRGMDLHEIFGAMLWLSVVAQFCDANLGGPPLSGAGVHELCRRLSCQVYLLLYGLFGLSQLIRMAAILWNGGVPGASHPAIVPPPENLRDYLAYGVLALLTIHLMAALQRQTSRGVAAP
jgi:cytochrome b561